MEVAFKPQLKKSFTVERELKDQFDILREIDATRKWIEAILEEPMQLSKEEEMETEFAQTLQDGTFLCKLMVKLQPGCILKFHNKPKIEFLMMENVQWFLEGCKLFGVNGEDLFSPMDIVEKKNTRKIIRTIHQLAELAKDRNLHVPCIPVYIILFTPL